MGRLERVLVAAYLGIGVGCSFAGDSTDDGTPLPDVDAAIPVSDFRRPVTVTPPSIGGPLTDVPLAIRLVRDEHLAGQVRADGADLFVLDADGVQLPLEIEQLDPDVGTLVAWVVLRELPAAGTTVFLHYGSDAPATGNDRNPWDGITDLVWHMAGLDGEIVLDSAPTAAHASRVSGSLSPVPGLFGSALEFADAAVLVNSTNSLDPESKSFSLEMWFNQTEAVSDEDTGFFKGGPTVGRPGYQIELGTGNWTGGVRDDDGAFNPNEEARVTFGTEAALGATGWHHLIMVLDRDAVEMRGYLDGELVDTDDTNSLSSLRNRDDEARVGGVSDLLRGAVDEVRLLTRPVSADWIAVDVANGLDTLAVVGDPVAVP